MSTTVITGSLGLVGSESVRFLSEKNMQVIGVDNDMRREFFGQAASTNWNLQILKEEYTNYTHWTADIRSEADMEKLFSKYSQDITLVVHAAAQPSHDWAYQNPAMDFTINAFGTLNLLEMTRKYCPKAVFIYLSTNKVYGDRSNFFPIVEKNTRWELEDTHPFFKHGIDESISIDDTTHSLFGVSKTAADLLVQEYGRNFGINTACFRGGCFTGSMHSGTELHGFLSYLMICAMKKKTYHIFGYKGKQVRDLLHSRDLAEALYAFYLNPGMGKVYNIGGGRFSNCSILEAISLCEEVTGNKITWKYEEKNRTGDHIWWVSDCRRFKGDHPKWTPKIDTHKILNEIHQGLRKRL